VTAPAIDPGRPLPLGHIVATPGALALAATIGRSLSEYLTRHAYGDWGDVDPSDWRANDDDARGGGRILSAYDTPGGKLWIITEADRSSTCFLLPSEY
jgi:hypothetical protein